MTTPTKWITTDTDRRAIYSTGETPERAVEIARLEAREPEAEFVVFRATERLCEYVEEFGGGPEIRWTVKGVGSDAVADLARYRVMSMDSGERLDGVPAPRLIQESERAPEGAVLARWTASGVWRYVAPAEADRVRRHERAEVVSVYVEEV